MKRIISIIVFAILVSSCGQPVSTISPTEKSVPATNIPLPRATPTRRPTFTSLPITVTPPATSTSTPGPVTDVEGNITWHPHEVLILSEGGGGDGVRFDYSPDFLLLWDGTLLQHGSFAPYISHLEQNEVCKLLNTIDASGFFEEVSYYNFPFDGLPSQYISVNSWKTNISGSQVLDYALSGMPYYDRHFCRDCPIPLADTIIKPGLANTYFLLDKYYVPNRKLAQVDKLIIRLSLEDDHPTHSWPLNSITAADLIDLFRKCEEEDCRRTGIVVDGDLALEIMNKIDTTQIFEVETSTGKTSFRIIYRAVWPYESFNMYSGVGPDSLPEVPADFTMTCKPAMGRFPILPLNPQNEFWYYSPNGKWGAEVVKTSDQHEQIRIVNAFEYEKYFNYDPNLFRQTTISIFPRYWTEDEKYFFVNVLPSDFDYQKTPFTNSLGLQQISLEDGKARYIFIGTNGESFAYEISRNGRQAAHIQQEETPLKIVVTDLYSLNQKSAVLVPPNGVSSFTVAGTIVWSSDGKYVLVAANYLENEKVNSVIIKINTFNPSFQSFVYKVASAIKLLPFSSFFGTDDRAGICPLEENDMGEFCGNQIDLSE